MNAAAICIKYRLSERMKTETTAALPTNDSAYATLLRRQRGKKAYVGHGKLHPASYTPSLPRSIPNFAAIPASA